MFRRSSKSNADANPMVIKNFPPAPATVPSTPARPDPAPRAEAAKAVGGELQISRSSSESGRCSYHRNKVLDLYCKVHKELICSNCTVTRHHECHKDPSLNGESPFQPVEDAAVELKGLVDTLVANELAKEEALRAAVKRVDGNNEEIQRSVAALSAELEATRLVLIQEIRAWCEQHLHRLEMVGNSKQEQLAAQEESLGAKADALTTYRRNTLGALKDAKVVTDLIPLCMRLLEKESPVPELTFSELEPVQKANLVFKQEGKNALVQELRGFGESGEDKKPEVVLPSPSDAVVDTTTTDDDDDLSSFS